MKSLVQFIAEAAETPFDFIYNNFMSGAEEYIDEDPGAKTFDKQVKALIKKFIKANKITSTSQIKVESSSPDWWKDFDIDVEENSDLEDMGELELSYEDIFSCELKDNKLYMCSQTGSYMNGDYFDVVFSKK